MRSRRFIDPFQRDDEAGFLNGRKIEEALFVFDCDLSSERNAAARIRRACALLQIEYPDAVTGCNQSAFSAPPFEIPVPAVMSDVADTVRGGGFSPALAHRFEMMLVEIALRDWLLAEVTMHASPPLRSFEPSRTNGSNDLTQPLT